MVRCSVCKEEILQKNPGHCPYCGSKELVSSEEAVLDEIDRLVRAGRIEEAALMYEELGMLDKANEVRESNMGKIKSINMECPHCRKSQPLASKSSEVTCQYCGKNYAVPKKVLEIL